MDNAKFLGINLKQDAISVNYYLQGEEWYSMKIHHKIRKCVDKVGQNYIFIYHLIQIIIYICSLCLAIIFLCLENKESFEYKMIIITYLTLSSTFLSVHIIAIIIFIKKKETCLNTCFKLLALFYVLQSVFGIFNTLTLVNYEFEEGITYFSLFLIICLIHFSNMFLYFILRGINFIITGILLCFEFIIRLFAGKLTNPCPPTDYSSLTPISPNVISIKLKVTSYDKEKTEAPKECIICLDQFSSTDKVIQLACNKKHTFHKDCLKEWMNAKDSCPICRNSIYSMRD